MKRFRQTSNVGRAKYVVSYHDGVKQHDDGSPFFDICLFSRKRGRDRFVRSLLADGYIEASPLETRKRA